MPQQHIGSFVGAHPPSLPLGWQLHSAQADASPRTIILEYMSDPSFDSGEEAEDGGNSNTASTISWAASSDGSEH
jgi:hypothetical protein